MKYRDKETGEVHEVERAANGLPFWWVWSGLEVKAINDRHFRARFEPVEQQEQEV